MFCAKTQLASSDGAGEEVELSSKELVPGDQILLPATGGKHQHQHPPPPPRHHYLYPDPFTCHWRQASYSELTHFLNFSPSRVSFFSCLVHLGKKCPNKLPSSSVWHDAQFSWVSLFSLQRKH